MPMFNYRVSFTDDRPDIEGTVEAKDVMAAADLLDEQYVDDAGSCVVTVSPKEV